MEKEFFKKLSNFVHTTQADIVIGASCEFTTMAGMDLLQRKTHTILETHSMRTSIEKNNPPAGNLLMRWAFKRRDKQLHQYIKHMSMQSLQIPASHLQASLSAPAYRNLSETSPQSPEFLLRHWSRQVPFLKFS